MQVQNISQEAAYQLERLNRKKKEIENKIKQTENDYDLLKKYLDSVKDLNRDVKTLPQKFFNIGSSLEKVCTDGKPMDNGQFKENGEKLTICSSKLTTLAFDINTQMASLVFEKSRLLSELGSIKSKISYYKKYS